MNGTTSAGFTVWFTGMSGAGKSTLATGLANRLRRLGKTVEVLDGGEAEQFLNVAHGQNKDERNLEARKLAWVCRLVTRGGGIVLQSAIESPYRETRDEARRQIGRFAEVFVECPTETLIQRDRSGRYKKALAGELKTLVGITEPYEPAGHAEVIVDTRKQPAASAARSCCRKSAKPPCSASEGSAARWLRIRAVSIQRSCLPWRAKRLGRAPSPLRRCRLPSLPTSWKERAPWRGSSASST